MSEKYSKFRPNNITPDQFMRPPTEAVRLPIAVNALLQEDQINTLAAQVARRSVFKRAAPKLQTGTELELFLFSDKSKPAVDLYKSTSSNPNYTSQHKRAFEGLTSLMFQPNSQGGLRDILYDGGDHFGSIGIEIRTKPQDVNGYFDAISQVSDWFRKNAGQFGINPVVWSQHLHLSLGDPTSGVNLLEDRAKRYIIGKGIVDMYHRAIPLLRLPENIEGEHFVMSYSGSGINTKGGFSFESGPRRIEGRVNNSDYASDPYLNLLMNLIGVKRGLRYITDHRKIDADYQLTNTDVPEHASFPIGGGRTSVSGTLRHLERDKVLAEELPHDLLWNLHRIASSYSAISEGTLGVEEARWRAYDIVDFSQKTDGQI
jgi:hypothetical protein